MKTLKMNYSEKRCWKYLTLYHYREKLACLLQAFSVIILLIKLPAFLSREVKSENLRYQHRL